MSAPKRIQLRRTKGWRKPTGAVVVTRPTRWGNPWRVERQDGGWRVRHDFGAAVGTWPTKTHAALFAVDAFRDAITRQANISVPGLEEIREQLRGKDLACWCPLGQPCHADVLLELANTDPAGPAPPGVVSMGGDHR